MSTNLKVMHRLSLVKVSSQDREPVASMCFRTKDPDVAHARHQVLISISLTVCVMILLVMTMMTTTMMMILVSS